MFVRYINHVENSMRQGFKPLTRAQFFDLCKKIEAMPVAH